MGLQPGSECVETNIVSFASTQVSPSQDIVDFMLNNTYGIVRHHMTRVILTEKKDTVVIRQKEQMARFVGNNPGEQVF